MTNRTIFVAHDARISIEPDGREMIHIPSKRVMVVEGIGWVEAIERIKGA